MSGTIQNLTKSLDNVLERLPFAQSATVVLLRDGVFMLRVSWHNGVASDVFSSKGVIESAQFDIDETLLNEIERAYKIWEVGEE